MTGLDNEIAGGRVTVEESAEHSGRMTDTLAELGRNAGEWCRRNCKRRPRCGSSAELVQVSWELSNSPVCPVRVAQSAWRTRARSRSNLARP